MFETSALRRSAFRFTPFYRGPRETRNAVFPAQSRTEVVLAVPGKCRRRRGAPSPHGRRQPSPRSTRPLSRRPTPTARGGRPCSASACARRHMRGLRRQEVVGFRPARRAGMALPRLLAAGRHYVLKAIPYEVPVSATPATASASWPSCRSSHRLPPRTGPVARC